MKKFSILLFGVIIFNNSAQSQGCIMVRNISGFGQYNVTDKSFSTEKWLININSRYFRSFRDFKEKTDLRTPKENMNTINSFSMDFGLTRLFDNGWSVSLSLPISANSRTTNREHGGPNTPRRTVRSFGLGDIRFSVYKWLLKPNQKGNIQAGLGIKLATGDYKYQGYYYRNDTTRVLVPVSLPIQLGDGGTGITTELNTYYMINKTISLYGNFYYLINPREVTGVSTMLGFTPSPLELKIGEDVSSVPDQYSIRAGMYFNYDKLILSAGLRDEGIPVYDLLGGSNGFRRSGHNLSFEPGISYKMKNVTFYAFVPILVVHKITQNVPDKLATKITGVYTTSVGGSGNYFVFVGAQFKL